MRNDMGCYLMLYQGVEDEDDAPHTGKKCDAYDMAVNSLRFESRGNPSERLKTEEELAQEDVERLEKLEVIEL